MKDETVAHLLTACEQLAGTQYLRRHNEVARIVHWNICKHFNIKRGKKHWLHVPEKVIDNSEVKILWDFEIRTDRVIPARRPDIVTINKSKREAKIIDIAVPEDGNIRKKEREKIEKYEDLRIELQRLWNLRKVEVVPVVIGALGATTSSLENYLARVPGEHRVPPLLKAALLGSAYILRRSLDLPESW